MGASSSGDTEHLHTWSETSLSALPREGAKPARSPDADPALKLGWLHVLAFNTQQYTYTHLHYCL